MGVYIYSVRTKNLKVEIEGETVSVHALQYLCRPFRFADPASDRLCAHAERFWENREPARFVHRTDVEGKPYDGAEVYEWDGRAVTDDYSFEGKLRTVGFLHKVGRRWTVAPIFFEVTFGTMKDGCYHIRKSKQAFTADEAKAIAFAECDAGERVTIATFEATNPELDRLVRENSAFSGFRDLLDAKGSYRPSLDCRDPLKVQIADAYDAAMALRGDERRAYRYGVN